LKHIKLRDIVLPKSSDFQVYCIYKEDVVSL